MACLFFCGWIVLYVLSIVGIGLLYAGWVPGADHLLGGRHVHSLGHYLGHFTRSFLVFAVAVTLLVFAFMGLNVWIRSAGGWRRFLPRFIFLLTFTALLMELMLRAVFVLPGGRWPALQNASLVADPFTDEAYWVLQTRLNPSELRTNVHPMRGWSQTYITEDNPQGLNQSTINKISRQEPVIRFFGDSFVQGMPFNKKTLPEMVEEQNAGIAVANLGVRGYGVDQMFLLSQELDVPVSGSEVWVGILTWDLDRVYMAFTYGQKPRYHIVNDLLVLSNTPITRLDREYIDTYQLSFSSWLAQAVRRKWQNRQGLERGGAERDEKIQINCAIIREWAAQCRENDIPIRIVLFHTRQDLNSDSWRNQAVKEICADLDIPLFDTATVLLPYLEKKGSWGQELYQEGDFHHTDLANEMIARWLVDHWVRGEAADADQKIIIP